VLGEALDALRDNGTLPGAHGFSIVRDVRDGIPMSEALGRFPDTFPAEDVLLVEAGEATGRLSENLDRLAALPDARRRGWRKLLTHAAYPLVVLHFAALLMPVSRLAMAHKLTVPNWLWEVLGTLAPLWGLFLLAFYLRRDATWRARFDAVLERVPGYGAAIRHRRRAIFATVLGAAYEGGVPVTSALSIAGRATHLPAAEGAAQAIDRGDRLADALVPTGIFPKTVLAQIATAEAAGELSEALHRIADEEAELADHTFRRAMTVTGVLISVAILGWIGWFVISFYLDRYAQLF
jgi:type II secretory pathway component PulF